ncbi:hypothetical protein DSD19_04505 [Rhodovulum sp. BSW8]|uniref:PLxRFG domain-containing protein n=1 Tax=Rhodovulum sp. BSW8 TaxID=2259645 RepID=UPI000DE4D981|nr:PLxRFG domain-containing protein [Rhodovulum sp. BSW8]RBO54643.1 hypothetical protein DSD19_04505 [Rhodovulum sp. BSW8]
MNRNVFALNPVEYEINRGQIEADRKRPDGPDFDALSRQHQVPQNVLEALTEAAGISDPAQVGKFADEAAARIGAQMKNGADVPGALRNVLGQEAPVQEVLDRALQIAGARPQAQAGQEDRPAPTMSRAASAANAVAQGAAGIGEMGLKGVAAADELREGRERRLDAAMQDQAGTGAGWAGARRVALEGAREIAARDGNAQEVAQIEQQLADLANFERDRAAQTAQDRPAYQSGQQFGDAARDRFKTDPAYQGDFWTDKVAQGAGSMLGFIGTTIATGGTGILLTGAAVNAGSVYDDAKQNGATEDQALQASGLGAYVGTTEAIPILEGLNRIAPGAGGRLVSALRHIAITAGEEAAQEAFTEFSNNLIAKGIYDPERGVLENVGESALIGAILGAGTGGIGATRRPVGPRDDDEGEKPVGFLPHPDPTTPSETGADGGSTALEVPASEQDTPSFGSEAGAPDVQNQPEHGPISRAAAQAPASVVGNFEAGSAVTIEGDGIDPLDATFVEETAGGIKVEDENGPYLIPRDDIASGRYRITRRGGDPLAPLAPAIEAQPPLPDLPQGVDRDVYDERVGIMMDSGMDEAEAQRRALDAILAQQKAAAQAQQQERAPKQAPVEPVSDAEAMEQADADAQGASAPQAQEDDRTINLDGMGEAMAAGAIGAVRKQAASDRPNAEIETVAQMIRAAEKRGFEVTDDDVREMDRIASEAFGADDFGQQIRAGLGRIFAGRKPAKVEQETPVAQPVSDPEQAIWDALSPRQRQVWARRAGLPEEDMGLVKARWSDAGDAGRAKLRALAGSTPLPGAPRGMEPDRVPQDPAAPPAPLPQERGPRYQEPEKPVAAPDPARRPEPPLPGPEPVAPPKKALAGDDAAALTEDLRAAWTAREDIPDTKDQVEAFKKASEPVKEAMERLRAAVGQKEANKILERIENDYAAGKKDAAKDRPLPSGVKARQTGPDVGEMTARQAYDALLKWIVDGHPESGGFFTFGGVSFSLSFDQWWGKNRVKEPEGKVFVSDGDSLDAIYFDTAAVKASIEKPSEPAAEARPTQQQEVEGREKIEDVGEKIGGARKDLAKRFRDSLTDLDSTDELRGYTLNELIPEPDYVALIEEGMDRETVAAIAWLRGQIGRKPAKGWKQLDWASDVKAARNEIRRLMDGEISAAEWGVELESGPKRDARESLTRKIAMATISKMHAVDFAIAGRAMFGGRSTKKSDSDEVDLSYEAWLRMPGDRNRYARGASPTALSNDLADAIREYRRHLEAKRAGEKPFDFRFHRRYRRSGGEHYIYARKPRLVKMRTFQSSEAAQAFLNDPEKMAELQKEAERMRTGARERRDENRDRVGPERRKGDVSADDFRKAFGFRGVEFGNYVKQGQRQDLVNDAYDALMDMAGALGIPAETLSLKGKLGFAFGARGQGRRGNFVAAAHYEPAKTVINLTRDAGAGSLAHEWWHAVDNHIAEINTGARSYALFTEGQINRQVQNLDGDFAKALRRLVREIGKTEWHRKMRQLDAMREKPYWSTNVEETARLFEAMVVERLEDRGMSNDFLANIDKSGGAYPSEKVIGELRDPFNSVIGFVEAEFTKDGGTVPDMPDLLPMARSRPPEPGREWSSPQGLRRITRERDIEGTPYFEILTVDTGAKTTVPKDEVARIIARDEYDATPEGQNEAKDLRDKKEAAQKRRDEYERVERELEARREAFIADEVKRRGTPNGKDETSFAYRIHDTLTKQVQNGQTRQQMVDDFVSRGGRVTDEGVKLENGVILPADWITKQIGLDYARWAAREHNILGAAEGLGAAVEKAQARMPKGFTLTAQRNEVVVRDGDRKLVGSTIADRAEEVDAAVDRAVAMAGDSAAENSAMKNPAPKSVKKSPAKRLTPKQMREAEAAKIKDYFTPGNVVSPYGGGADIVISYREDESGNPIVRVQRAVKDGDTWIPDPKEGIRTHGTRPNARELQQGPIWRADPTPEAENEPAPKPDAGPKKGLANLSEEENAQLADLEKLLAGKLRNEVRSGLDPELVTIAFKIGHLYVKAGMRRFRQVLETMMDRMGLTLEEAQPYARNAYGQIRDDLELAGENVADMDGAAEVIAIVRAMREEEKAAEAQKPKAQEPPADESEPALLAGAFARAFTLRQNFKNIVEARKFAGETLERAIEKGDHKMIEEALEIALVARARAIAATSDSHAAAFDALVDLYKAQPKLNQRTSTSMEQQAYSTPAPLAYLASRLAGIDAGKAVYEPAAGNGMLLIEADPERTAANELNPDRFAGLKRLFGAKGRITNEDALTVNQPSGRDVVIGNPPFGKVKSDTGETREFAVPLFGAETFKTTEIDQAIMLRALEAMKPDGRAVFIIGSHQGDQDTRKSKYRAKRSRMFMNRLYENFNVTEHFTIDGKLYDRQGAGWPVDVIVIEGHGKASKPLPMAEPPVVYDDWAQLKERLDGQDSLDPRSGRNGDGGDLGDGPGRSPDEGGVSPGAEQQDRPAGQVGDEGRPGSSGDGGRTYVGERQADAAEEPDGAGASARGGQRDAGNGERDGRGDLAGEGDQAQPADGGDSGSRNLGGVPRGLVRVERHNTEAETSLQVQYAHRSNAQFAVGTVMPRNMQEAIARALDDLSSRVGDIDDFVAAELGYSRDELLGTPKSKGYFSAEQVDAIALAIDNIGKGAGFIVGDQTGVGKGRVVAAMLRYAMRNGKIPVFLTKEPGLYADMMRDLRDIGMGDVLPQILVTNNDLRGKKALDVGNGEALTSRPKSQINDALSTIMRTGRPPQDVGLIFTTYSQMQLVKKRPTPRMNALEALAPNAMFVLDESHEAGGTAAGGRAPSDEMNRSTFIRGLLRNSGGTMFSSATYAKNPHVMSLYFKTDLSLAVDNIDTLSTVISEGGVPLQQVIANMLVEARQYVRRERSFEGVEMQLEQLATDTQAGKDGARALREVFALDRDFMQDVREAFAEELAEKGEIGAKDGAVGEESASSVNFASIMHNVVSQLLLSLKAQSAVDMAVEAHKRGEKPIIALSNTNASIMSDYVDDHGIGEGDPLDVPFNAILDRYLARLRRITVKDAQDNKRHEWLSDTDIVRLGGKSALDAFQRVEASIRGMKLKGLSGSPIDFILEGLRAAGVRVAEITGRSLTIENGKLARREASAAAKRRTMNAYNSGEIDALVINRSGSTGFSMHATAAPDNDGKPRHMFILQPEPNIDVFMQMLGRIHRTGQIKLPRYTIAVSDLAVEKRPAAVLMRKMASLSANTTASKKSAVNLDNVVDFLNIYGDRVMRNYLRENMDVAQELDVIPGKEIDGLAARATGRMAILEPEQAARIYEDIETIYTEYIETLDRLGQNGLEAKTLELDAKTLHKAEIEPGIENGSPFQRPAYIERVDVKVMGRPYKPEELQAELDKVLAGRAPGDVTREIVQQLRGDLPAELDKIAETRSAAVKRLDAAKTEKQKDSAQDAINRADTRRQNAQESLRQIVSMVETHLAPGEPLRIRTAPPEGGGAAGDPVAAVSLGVDVSRAKGTPLAPSRMMVRLAIANPGREIRVPLSRLMGDDREYELDSLSSSWDAVMKAFEEGNAETRETRQMVTGNLVSGFAKFKQGQIVMFTRKDGTIDQGILMPQNFDPKRKLESLPVRFTDPAHMIEFLHAEVDSSAPPMLMTSDGIVGLVRSNGAYSITIKTSGGRPYVLNRAVRDLVGDFEQRRGAKVFAKSITSPSDLRKLVALWQDNIGAEFQAEAFKDVARMITGEEIPDLGEDGDQAGLDLGPRAKRREGPARPAPKAGARRRLVADLKRELRQLVPGRDVKLDVRDGSIDIGGETDLDGYFLDNVIGVSTSAKDGAKGVMRHEVIHMLRSSALWGGTHGLFTRDEWQTLVRAARADQKTRKKVRDLYPDLGENAQIEEVIAEMFREWSEKKDAQPAVMRALEKVGKLLNAFIRVLRQNKADQAADVFQRVRSGEIGGRGGPDGPRGPGGGLKAKRRKGEKPTADWGHAPVVQAESIEAGEKSIVSHALTQAMDGIGGLGLLSMVPGRPLFTELGRGIPSAKKYLRLKEQMDTLRNELHAESDKIAQKWRQLAKQDRKANNRLMDLMHRSTIEGIDPSEPFKRRAELRDKDILGTSAQSSKTWKEAKKRLDEDARREPIHAELKAEYQALPEDYRAMYRTVRDEYARLADEFERAIAQNAQKAMEVAVRRAERAHTREMERIEDDGLEGQERADAIEAADRALKTAKARGGWSKQARLNQLRERFESNRLEGPYFPLQRFGKYYLTLRDENGKVESFSLFESERELDKAAKQARREGYEIRSGDMGVRDKAEFRDMVDPNFVADVEALLEEIDADSTVMDTIWQRWLETLPDASLRKSRIHRKATPGYSTDALRAFGHKMFHGAHQLARLKYALDMSEALDVAQEEVKATVDPVRNGLILEEMRRRHDFTMNPTGSVFAQAMTSAAFFYYLGMSPAAAIVNLTQTTIVGVPVLGAFYGKGGITAASRAVTRALADFTRGKGHAAESARLTADEKEAMQAAYDMGVVDKTQGHDIAGVGETGVEYSPTRTRVMAFVSWFFHHAERLNREVTFLAAYRLARDKGQPHADAVDAAADLTWKSHFDYQNTSRPRIMQSDWMKVILVFRNFQVNMLWRLFRDTHQAFHGASPEVRQEARRQLAGITTMMLFHAGVKGVWGYSLLMMLMGMFFPGGDDEAEESLEKMLFSILPKDAVGALLNGVPGHLSGVDLRARVGMPDLWFRSPDRQLEGEDEYAYWLQELVGAAPGMVENLWRGGDMILDSRFWTDLDELLPGGHAWRGAETASPKFIRDQMRTIRYLREGAETYNGDPIIEHFKPLETLLQAIGFTPARLSERYDANTRLKNRERAILDERKSIMQDAAESVMAGRGLSDAVRDEIRLFNAENRDYPITHESLIRSIRGRQSRSARNEFGVQLNPKLNERLRREMAPLVYD